MVISWEQLKEHCEAQFSLCKRGHSIVRLLLKINTVMLQNYLRLTKQFTESKAASCMPQQAICRGLLEGFSQ
jgi:hypothetical protein